MKKPGVSPPIGTKTFLKTVAAITAVFLIVLIGVPLLVDKNAYIERVLAAIEHTTGYEASVDQVSFQVFPLPTLRLKGVRIENSTRAVTESFFSAFDISVALDIPSLLSGRIVPASMAVERPSLQLERFEDGSVNWDFISDWKKGGIAAFFPANIGITGGAISLTDSRTHRVLDITQVQLDSRLGRSMSVKGSFKAFDKEWKIHSSVTGYLNNLEDYRLQGSWSIRQAEDTISFNGTVGRQATEPTIEGELSATFKDMIPWLRAYHGADTRMEVLKTIKTAFPATFSMSMDTKAEGIAFENIQLSAGRTAGSGSAIYQRESNQLDLKWRFTPLILEPLFGDGQTSANTQMLSAFFARFLLKDLTADIDLEADRLEVGSAKANRGFLKATLSDGELTINQAAMDFPGDTRFLVFGILKRDSEGEAHFDGYSELVGKSLPDFLAGLNIDKHDHFSEHQGAFRSKASVFLSRRHSVVSDFKFQAGDFYAAGGANIGGYDVEGASEESGDITLLIRGARLDGLAGLLFPRVSEMRGGRGGLTEDINRRIPWLDRVASRHRFNVLLQDYSLSGVQGKRAAMQCSLKPKALSCSQINLDRGDISLRGDVSFSQQEELPNLTADLYVSALNLKPFTSSPLRQVPVRRGNTVSVWPDNYFNFGYLKGYNGTVKLASDEVMHDDFVLSSAVMEASGENGAWKIKHLDGDLWGGTLKSTAVLDVTSIPSLSLSFSLADVQSDKLFFALAQQDNFDGNISLNGQVVTYGVGAHEWVKHANGNFIMQASDIALQGLDLPGLIKSVPGMRTVSDVVNTVRIIMLKNQTTFDLIEGGFSMERGMLSFSGLKMRSKHAVGTLTGQASLDTWVMDLAIRLELLSLSPGEYPVLDVLLRDSMDDPVVSVDTRSLEAFIARKKLR